MRAPINLNRLAYFAAVVEAGSFTAAAARLGVTKAVVSQQIARLEEATGSALLLRTTRRVQPSEAGRLLHARCAVILGEAERAFDELAQGAAEPTGTLRITAPFDLGTAVIVPVVTAFSRRHPACSVVLNLTDRTLDLTAEGFDLGIRVGWLADSALQTRRIGGFRQVLVAGRAWREATADLPGPEGLPALPFVANLALREPDRWEFTRGDERRAVQLRPAISIDATLAVREALLAGAGLSVLPDFLLGDDLAKGRLHTVLPEWSLPEGGIHAVFPATRFRPTKVSAFVEMLVAAARHPGGLAAPFPATRLPP
jgi:DNA-binding transcriptional LysR family regulator